MSRKSLSSEIKAAIPHLTRGSGGLAGEVLDVRNDLIRCMDRIENEVLGLTTDNLVNVWVRGTTGSDDNDGRTSATALKTLSAAKELIADKINNYVVLHLREEIECELADKIPSSWVASHLFYKAVAEGRLLIDGGPDLTEVVASMAADIHSNYTLGVTGAGWTPGQFFGLWVEVLDGPAAGQIRAIAGNTADTIEFNSYFLDGTPAPLDPGACNFRIVKPATVLKTAAVNGALPWFTGGLGCWSMHIQRLTIQGDRRLTMQGKGCSISACVFENTAPDACLVIAIPTCGSGCVMGIYDPATFAWEDTNWRVGVCCTALAGGGYDIALLFANGIVPLEGVVAKLVAVGNHNGQLNASGSRMLSMLLTNSGATWPFNLGAAYKGDATLNRPLNIGGLFPVVWGTPVAPALMLLNSFAKLDNMVTDYGTNGIEMVGSTAIIKAVSGANNGAFGVHAHGKSTVLTEAGTTPTVAGATGDLSTDGATQASTWAAILGGTPVADFEAVAKNWANWFGL
jgi:hypothetical protein